MSEKRKSEERKSEISVNDIQQYLDDNSDFTFEMRVLSKVVSLNYDCEHSGTYKDPLTGKFREFDIRAQWDIGNRGFVFSLECKNLRKENPLVVHCVPRLESEARHQIISFPKPRTKDFGPFGSSTALLTTSNYCRADSISVFGTRSIYRPGGFVGKSMDQVSKDSKGNIKASDGHVFDKMTQGLNVCHDLGNEVIYSDCEEERHYSLMPVLVVPDDTLFEVRYDDNGKLLSAPTPSKHIQYYVDRSIRLGHDRNYLWFNISHLEIVTFSEIENFLFDLTQRTSLIPSDDVIQELRKNLGIEKVTLKDLRRASLRWLGHYSNLGLIPLKNHARHTDVSTTSLYLRTPEEEAQSTPELDFAF